MGLTNAYRDLLATMTVGEAYTAYDAANAYIGVGDSATAFAASQTDLQAATNKLRKAMDATYPTRTGNVMTFRSTFDTGDANFDWNEWGVFNASSAGTMMFRDTTAKGPKTSADSWEFTIDVTLTV